MKASHEVLGINDVNTSIKQVDSLAPAVVVFLVTGMGNDRMPHPDPCPFHDLSLIHLHSHLDYFHERFVRRYNPAFFSRFDIN